MLERWKISIWDQLILQSADFHRGNYFFDMILTLLVVKPEYLGETRSLPRLLMSWLLVSPGHQLPWCWLCIIFSIFKVPAPSQYCEMIENTNIFYASWKKFNTTRVKLILCLLMLLFCSSIWWKAGIIALCWVNSLVPGIWGCNLKLVIFKLMSRVDILSISCKIAFRWMPQDYTDD